MTDPYKQVLTRKGLDALREELQVLSRRQHARVEAIDDFGLDDRDQSTEAQFERKLFEGLGTENALRVLKVMPEAIDNLDNLLAEHVKPLATVSSHAPEPGEMLNRLLEERNRVSLTGEDFMEIATQAWVGACEVQIDSAPEPSLLEEIKAYSGFLHRYLESLWEQCVALENAPDTKRTRG